ACAAKALPACESRPHRRNEQRDLTIRSLQALSSIEWVWRKRRLFYSAKRRRCRKSKKHARPICAKSCCQTGQRLQSCPFNNLSHELSESFMAFLQGKKILITGLLSNRSIAYGIAAACKREGAE